MSTYSLQVLLCGELNRFVAYSACDVNAYRYEDDEGDEFRVIRVRNNKTYNLGDVLWKPFGSNDWFYLCNVLA